MKKRWLVTGGLGFIGSAFVRIVHKERDDVEITVLDALTYAGNPKNVEGLESSSRYRFVKGDIRDPEAVECAIDSGVDAIINFAAETHVDRSIVDPGSFINTDVYGTHILLEAVRKHRVSRFLQVSTDEVYGDVSSGFSSEQSPIRPRSPYAASKAGGDLQVMAYRETFDAPVMITRGSNTFGPYQYPEKLIPLFVTNLLEGKSVPVYGDGKQVRDWIYVDDHARGILHVLEFGELGGIYNLGGNNQRENIEITRKLLALTGRDPESSIRHVTDRLGHDRRYALDSSKAQKLGWRQRVDFETGIASTVDWYRGNEAWWKPIKSGEFQEYYQQQYAKR